MTIRHPNKLLWLFSRHRSICGIETAVFLSSKAEAEAAFAKIEAALNLMQQCDPRRMACLKRDVKRILVWGAPHYQGVWHQQYAMWELTFDFVRSQDTTPAILAATLAHEAMHARLMRWGFGYEEGIRVRIEAVCLKASMRFARRLPLSEMASRGHIMWSAKQKLNVDTTFWSDQGRLEAKAAALLELGFPAWLVRFLLRRGQARLRRYQSNASAKDTWFGGWWHAKESP
jgi:hypothetical protein